MRPRLFASFLALFLLNPPALAKLSANHDALSDLEKRVGEVDYLTSALPKLKANLRGPENQAQLEKLNKAYQAAKAQDPSNNHLKLKDVAQHLGPDQTQVSDLGAIIELCQILAPYVAPVVIGASVYALTKGNAAERRTYSASERAACSKDLRSLFFDSGTGPKYGEASPGSDSSG